VLQLLLRSLSCAARRRDTQQNGDRTYIREINYDAFANRCIARSCASPEVSGMACFRAIFSFHLLRIYGADLLCLVYDGGSDIPRICFVQLIILAGFSTLARMFVLCKFSIRQGKGDRCLDILFPRTYTTDKKLRQRRT